MSSIGKFTTALLVAALATQATAHYNFDRLIVNGQVTGEYEYVRSSKNSNSPVEDVTSSAMTCNVGGNDADVRAKTKTLTVQAGDELGFTVRDNLGHPGPQTVYLSKAPAGTSAQDYTGNGDWFKIYSLGVKEYKADYTTEWAVMPDETPGGIRNFTFTLPEQTPSGDYLIRAEHIGLHGAGEVGKAQFYIGCGQIRVEGSGSGSGTPGPTVKIPGAFTAQDPGVHVGIYWPPLTDYKTPGPAVWPGRCEDHTANLAGQASDGDCTPLQ